MTEYFSHPPPFWEGNLFTPEEEKERATLMGKEIEALNLEKYTASKYVDFGDEEFDVVFEWDMTSGLAVVANLKVYEHSGGTLCHYELCDPRLVGRGRVYWLLSVKGVGSALLELKRDLARELKDSKIEKLETKEVYSILDQIDEEKAERLKEREFKPEEIGFNIEEIEMIIDRARREREERYREEMNAFGVPPQEVEEVLKRGKENGNLDEQEGEETRQYIEMLGQEKKVLEQYRNRFVLRRWDIELEIMAIEDDIELERNYEGQNELPPTPFPGPRWNYLVEYDLKREIALVANCGLAKHRGCWNELIFTNVALIGKTWHNFLPPAYANKSIDEGIRWMCWMEEGDYFVKEV